MAEVAGSSGFPMGFFFFFFFFLIWVFVPVGFWVFLGFCSDGFVCVCVCF